MIDIWNMTDTDDVVDAEPYRLKLLKIVHSEDNLKLEKQFNSYLDVEACVRQKKVSSKILQIFKVVFGAKPPKSEVFNVTFGLLFNNQLTSSTLRNALIKSGFTEKTSNAQTHQMLRALAILKITTLNHYGVLEPNNESVLLDKLKNQSWSAI